MLTKMTQEAISTEAVNPNLSLMLHLICFGDVNKEQRMTPHPNQLQVGKPDKLVVVQKPTT